MPAAPFSIRCNIRAVDIEPAMLDAAKRQIDQYNAIVRNPNITAGQKRPGCREAIAALQKIAQGLPADSGTGERRARHDLAVFILGPMEQHFSSHLGPMRGIRRILNDLLNGLAAAGTSYGIFNMIFHGKLDTDVTMFLGSLVAVCITSTNYFTETEALAPVILPDLLPNPSARLLADPSEGRNSD